MSIGLEGAAQEVKDATDALQEAEAERVAIYAKADDADKNYRIAKERLDEAKRVLSEVASQ